MSSIDVEKLLEPMDGDRRLLPVAIDDIARLEPESLYAEYPRSSTSYDAGFTAVTFGQLSSAINGAAWLLEAELGRGLNHETLAYIGPSDLRYMVLAIAAVKTGYKLLWTSPLNSLPAHLHLFTLLNCSTLVTVEPEPQAVSNLKGTNLMRIIHVPGLEELLAGHYPHYPYNKTFEEARYEPLIALHTSGSTGFPKPIIYSHEFGNTYVNLITSPKPQGFSSANALFQGNRLLQVLPPFHASGMLITLLNAVYTRTVMILPLPGVPPSGEGVIAALDHVKVDIAFLYPAVVKEIYQSPALLEGISRIPYVFYAGGDLPDGVGDALSARTRFFTMFGATEIGNFPQLISDVDIDHWEPNDWAYVCPAPAMGAEFRQHTADLYELVIVKDKSLEDYQTCFRIFPEMQEYSLRDLFSKHPTKPGLWRHRGRTDDILVFLNAEKMNPVPMEEAIQAHPSIRSVLLVGERRSQTALLIELMNDTITSRPERDAMIERLWPIIQAANDQVDEFARVSRSLILLLGPGQSMERAGKGTVQRKPTLDLYSDQLDALYAKAGEGGLGLCK